MYLYWGYPQGRNYAHVDNILKIMNFLKILHFAIIGSHTYLPKIPILYLAQHTHYKDTHKWMQYGIIFTFCTFCVIHSKDTNFIFGRAHTLYRYTQMDTDTVSFSLFAIFMSYMPKTQILYLAYHRHTHTQIHTCAETPAHMDTQIDTNRHMHINTHECTWRHT